MDSSETRATTSIGRAAFLLLLLASLIAFRYGWFVRPASGDESAQSGAASERKGNVLLTDWNSKFAKDYGQAKAKALARQVASPPWYAGQYEIHLVEDMGDTHRDVILITPTAEYFSEIHTCITNGPISYGPVRELREGLLELCPQESWQPGWEPCMRMYAIRWGQRQYLIGEDRVGKFMREVTGGREPRSNGEGEFFMRAGDWDKPAEGKPQLPKFNH